MAKLRAAGATCVAGEILNGRRSRPSRDFGTRLVLGLGAYPAPVPHTRPTQLASTATTPELAQRVGSPVGGTINVPADKKFLGTP